MRWPSLSVTVAVRLVSSTPDENVRVSRTGGWLCAAASAHVRTIGRRTATGYFARINLPYWADSSRFDQRFGAKYSASHACANASREGLRIRLLARGRGGDGRHAVARARAGGG